ERALLQTPGVVSAGVNLATNQATVQIDPAQVQPPALIAAVEHSGYGAKKGSVDEPQLGRPDLNVREAVVWRARFLFSLTLLAPIVVLHFFAGHHVAMELRWLIVAIASLQQIVVGWPFYVGALRRLRFGDTNMDTLIALGTTAAYGAGLA